MKLFDKDGKEYDVRHTVDAKEWIATGNFFEVNPKAEAPKKTTRKK